MWLAHQPPSNPPPSPPIAALAEGVSSYFGLLPPVLAWYLASVLSYTLRRVHLVRILFVDIDARLRFSILGICSVRRWLLESSASTKSLPFLSTAREHHQVYSSMENDLHACLWGNEVDAVRFFYRDFQEIELCAGRIQSQFVDLTKIYVRSAGGDEYRRARQTSRSLIEHNLYIIEMVLESWLQTFGIKLWLNDRSASNLEPTYCESRSTPNDLRSHMKKRINHSLFGTTTRTRGNGMQSLKYPNVARHLFYPRWFSYAAISVVPLSIMFVALIAVMWHFPLAFWIRGLVGLLVIVIGLNRFAVVL